MSEKTVQADYDALLDVLHETDRTEGCCGPGNWCCFKSYSELAVDCANELKPLKAENAKLRGAIAHLRQNSSCSPRLDEAGEPSILSMAMNKRMAEALETVAYQQASNLVKVVGGALAEAEADKAQKCRDFVIACGGDPDGEVGPLQMGQDLLAENAKLRDGLRAYRNSCHGECTWYAACPRCKTAELLLEGEPTP